MNGFDDFGWWTTGVWWRIKLSSRKLAKQLFTENFRFAQSCFVIQKIPFQTHEYCNFNTKCKWKWNTTIYCVSMHRHQSIVFHELTLLCVVFYIKFLIMMTIVRLNEMIFYLRCLTIYTHTELGAKRKIRRESPSFKICGRGSKPRNHESFMKQQKGSAEMSQWVEQTEKRQRRKKGEAWMESWVWENKLTWNHERRVAKTKRKK